MSYVAQKPVFLQWASDSAFWRDVTTQFISAVAAAGVLAVIFILTGGYSKTVRYSVAVGLIVLAGLVIVSAYVLILFRDFYHTANIRFRHAARFALTSTLLVFVASWFFGNFDLIQQSVARWAERNPTG